jgi:GNAT superfamily N-acetyltransferase
VLSATTDVISLRTVDPSYWELLRDVRLRSLKESPEAFTSTHEREAAFDEATWRDRAASGHSFVAMDGVQPVGVATGVEGWSGDPAKRELVGMWVDPSHRGQGLATILVARVAAWALSDGAEILTLGVIEGNARARRSYLKMGLLPTGERLPVWNDSSRFVEVMEAAVRDLDRS